MTPNLRVLLVDDDAPSLYAYARLLERAGAEVVACASPTTARELLERDSAGFDFVVTDYWMPQMTGAQLLSSVRASLGERTPPFVLVTAMMAPIPSVQRARFAAVLEKPFAFGSLRNAIASLGPVDAPA